MKNKLSLKLLTRWIAVPLLVGSLFAWVVSPAYPSDVVSRTAQPQKPQVAIKVASENASDVQDIKDRIKELESKERQNYTLLLDDQRKKIDWWFSFLAVLTAVMAIAGGLIPFLMARKDKELIEQDKAQVIQMKDDVAKLLADAKLDTEKIHQHEVSVAEIKVQMQAYQSKPEGKTDEVKNEDIAASFNLVSEDKTTNPISPLRAAAITASETDDANKAYALWNAITQLQPDDANVQFNAGYWAQRLANKYPSDVLHWQQSAEEHYDLALKIDAEMYGAANNLGNVLYKKAGVLSSSDIVAARRLWQQAGEQYKRALRIKPDMHGAAYNWGLALSEEAGALAAIDLPAARSLWRKAGEKYQLALHIKPDKYDAAKSWGSALDDEAGALAASDLVTARRLWQQAGEKYQEALNINPDMHDAANYWGLALLRESGVIELSDAEHSMVMLSQAEKILLAHSDAAPGVVSYNLACVYARRGDVRRCLHWLSICQANNELPDCGHLNSDKDIDPVRNTPEFIAWFATVCGSADSSGTV